MLVGQSPRDQVMSRDLIVLNISQARPLGSVGAMPIFGHKAWIALPT